MIAKIAEGRNDGKSNFRTLLDYIVGKEKERAVYIGTRNIDTEDGETPNHQEVAREMKGLALLNTRYVRWCNGGAIILTGWRSGTHVWIFIAKKFPSRECGFLWGVLISDGGVLRGMNS